MGNVSVIWKTNTSAYKAAEKLLKKHGFQTEHENDYIEIYGGQDINPKQAVYNIGIHQYKDAGWTHVAYMKIIGPFNPLLNSNPPMLMKLRDENNNSIESVVPTDLTEVNEIWSNVLALVVEQMGIYSRMGQSMKNSHI